MSALEDDCPIQPVPRINGKGKTEFPGSGSGVIPLSRLEQMLAWWHDGGRFSPANAAELASHAETLMWRLELLRKEAAEEKSGVIFCDGVIEGLREAVKIMEGRWR